MQSDRYIFHDVIQGSEQWLELRLGKFTASTCNDLLSGTSTLGYTKLLSRIAFERVTKEKPELFKSEYMERGNLLEPEALDAYRIKEFKSVSNGGFCELNDFVGCSPDGFVGSDGLVQVKCPSYHIMIDAIISNKVPSDYYKQVNFEMWVTGRAWCDLFFYHPKLKSVTIRVDRDEELIKQIEERIEGTKSKILEVIELIK